MVRNQKRRRDAMKGRAVKGLKLPGIAALSVVFSAGSLMAYQAYMAKAKKFGGEDCLFCHVHENGGVGWNERGDWLIEEKTKRKAEKIDVDWLVDYNPDEEDSSKKRPAEEKSGKKPASAFSRLDSYEHVVAHPRETTLTP